MSDPLSCTVQKAEGRKDNSFIYFIYRKSQRESNTLEKIKKTKSTTNIWDYEELMIRQDKSITTKLADKPGIFHQNFQMGFMMLKTTFILPNLDQKTTNMPLLVTLFIGIEN